MKTLVKPYPPYPIATTIQGVTLANFSSPHPFEFTDGTYLPACHRERVEMGALETSETERPGVKGTTDILLHFDLSESVIAMLDELHLDPDVDLIIVPFPVQDCLRSHELLDHYSKCRVIRMADRVAKIAHHDRFCR